jgi:hypothetical protein
VRETWLHTNRRAIIFGCVPPLAIFALGAWMVFGSRTQGDHLWRWPGFVIMLFGAGTIATLIRQLRRPRIAFENGRVLFYLRNGPPIAVPLDIVEAFFAGQGPAHLPVMTKQPQTVNLVARLSQRHTEWASQSVKPALGNWSDGYVTIRGSWCEPLDAEVIRRLNRRLKEVKDAT